ncbi:MAG: type III-B CRISPR-associated protein Cas10/Cmr2 [Firmicutes bacterium]|jgi:CRISPR-associated protein Cmr2|nr:type III-B CRISPR-associated protein Cas10/Cmr2 [Bacillota bacterium]MDH7494651.1 type III-B CRISPR-associated protein Cas10/Cmr2 [Bacillota bacterium]
MDGPEEELKAAADAAREGLQRAWGRLAGGVWSFLSGLHIPQWGTPDLHHQWNIQVERQWEISWVISDDPVDLDRRKNWRVFNGFEDPGSRCSQCGERSALSKSRGGRYGEVRAFWEGIAEHANDADRGVLFQEGERLCAVCTIKRIYPLLPETLGHGLRPLTHFASTPTIAATEWVQSVLEAIRSASASSPSQPKGCKLRDAWERLLTIADQAGVQCPACHPDERPFECDGNLYYIDELVGQSGRFTQERSSKGLPLKKESLRPEITKAVRELKRTLGKGPIPVYALLAMDGDHMGAIVRSVKDPSQLSLALANFGSAVHDIVDEHHGRPVYVGGDDVLAFFPAMQAMRAADRIRKAYRDCFRQIGVSHATISAGIVFADMREPLRDVIAAAHRVLDDMAKAHAGRNAFAILLMKHSGSSAVMAKKWEEEKQDGSIIEWVDEIYSLADDIRREDISTSLLYALKNLLDAFVPERGLAPSCNDEHSLVQFVASEYLRNRLLPWPEGTTPEAKRQRAEQQARRLLAVAAVPGSTMRLNMDGPIIARFLSGRREVS